MDLKTLQRFCREDPERSLGKPWTKDGFTYASNGFILLRVPALQEDPSGLGVALDGVYKQAGAMPETGWVGLSDLPMAPVCPKCNGKAEADSECPECGGDGDVEFHNGHHSYTCDCKTCDGSGEIEGCTECHGSGVAKEDPIRVGSRKFDPGMLRLASTLPGAQAAPTSASVNWFKFDGGDGLLMPLTECNH